MNVGFNHLYQFKHNCGCTLIAIFLFDRGDLNSENLRSNTWLWNCPDTYLTTEITLISLTARASSSWGLSGLRLGVIGCQRWAAVRALWALASIDGIRDRPIPKRCITAHKCAVSGATCPHTWWRSRAGKASLTWNMSKKYLSIINKMKLSVLYT